MDNSLEKLFQQVLELEGLVSLAIKRGADVPDMVVSMIASKAAEVADAAKAFTPAAPAATTPATGIDALPDDEPDDDIDLEIIEAPDDEETVPQEPDQQPSAIDELPDDEPDEDIDLEIIEAPDYEEAAPSEEEAPSEEAAPSEEEAPSEPAPAMQPAEEPSIIVVPATPAEEPQQPAAEEPQETINDAAGDGEITLDEAIQRDMTKDLRHAFSLNDRYRYRRELFENSDTVMNDTLNLVATMHSFEEAEDYFYNDLQWDYESPEVADFMVIVKNHFWNKRQD